MLVSVLACVSTVRGLGRGVVWEGPWGRAGRLGVTRAVSKHVDAV